VFLFRDFRQLDFHARIHVVASAVSHPKVFDNSSARSIVVLSSSELNR